MPSSLTPFAAALNAHNLVLVQGARAARWLRNTLRCEDAPSSTHCGVRSWTEWTQALWSGLLLEGHDDRILLNRWQEEDLWTRSLHEALAAEQVQLTESAARDLAPLARRAIAHACEQRLQHRLAAEADSYDSKIVARAWALIQKRCAHDRLLCPAQLEEALAQHIETGTCSPLPRDIVLGGAWETTPAQTYVVRALERYGVSTRNLPIQADPSSEGSRWWMPADDMTSSYEIAVRFAVQQARMGQARHVALITPQPASCRLELESVFRRYVAPELGSITEDLSSTPWSFASDPPAASKPMIAEALEVLRWCVEPAPIATIRRLIGSSYFSTAETTEARARLANALGAEPMWHPSLSLSEFLKVSRPLADAALLCPWIDVAAGIEDVATSSAPRSITQWVALTRQLLKLAGWPGRKPLSAAEYRTMQQWEHLLDGLSTLQLLEVRTSFSGFLSLLAREMNRPGETLRRETPPLQVLTPEEAKDQLFDLGVVLDETVLMPRETLDPLLPLSLQRPAGLEREEQMRGTSMHTPEFILSCRSVLIVKTKEADAVADPAPWLLESGFLRIEPEEVLPAMDEPAQLALEPVQEVAALPFLHTDEAFGGTQVLELQAACGFRAFASLRLRSTAPETKELGIDARAAGNALHDALRGFWAGTRSRSALVSMTEAQREESVREAVRAALAAVPNRDRWEAHYRTVLQRRYERLLRLWLDEELRRGPFEVVVQEQPRELTLGRLRLSLRPDRIDQVEDGLVFVDYKSSRDLAVRAWEGERPDAPQLPAYALTETSMRVRGIAFAQIRPAQKQRRWIGLADADGILPPQGKAPVQADLSQRMEDWRRELTTLAEAFVAGDVRVRPKEYPHTCRYCAQRPLCRIDPTTLETSGGAPDGPERDEHG